MSHNAYVREFGIWNPGVVFHGELQALDQTLFKAINGDDGGTWAPLIPIIIGGAGLTSRFVGTSFMQNGSVLHFNSGSTLTMDGGSQAFISADLTLNSGSTLTSFGTVTIASDALLEAAAGSTVRVSGNFETISAGGTSTFGADCFFNAFCDFEASVTFGAGGDVSFQGPTTFAGQANMGGGVVMSNNLAMSGTGTVLWRVVPGAKEDHTYSVSQVDEIVVDSSLGTAVTYSIDNTGASEGKRIRISAFGLPANVNIGVTIQKLSPSPTVLTALSGLTQGLVREWVELVFLGGTWRLSAAGTRYDH